MSAYLLVYNVAQAIAWSYLLFTVVSNALRGVSPQASWNEIGTLAWLAQNGAMLEVVHAIVRLVSSPVGTTALQVLSRVALINTVAYVPTAQAHWISQWMIAAWALVEVVRYPYYALGIVGARVPHTFTWVRYSIFLFDYPAGVAGELGTLLVSAPYLREHVGEWAYYGVFGLMVIYAWGLPTMYKFMLGQRRKYLGSDAGAKKAKKSS